MTVRDEHGNEIEDPDLRFESIAPATTTSNGIEVSRAGFLDLSGTPKNFKSGSVKVRLTSTEWTQPLDVTQKISTSSLPEPDSLLLSVNSMKLSYDTLNKMDQFTVGVRYKGSKAIPDNIVYVKSDKGTPDDKAVDECVFHDDKGNLIFDCKGLVDIIDENPKWKGLIPSSSDLRCSTSPRSPRSPSQCRSRPWYPWESREISTYSTGRPHMLS